MVITKLSRLKDFVEAGDDLKAIRLAASFWDLGNAKTAVHRAAAAMTSPELYRQMGEDPDLLVTDGIEAIKERYKW